MTAQDIYQALEQTCGAPTMKDDFLYHVGEFIAGREHQQHGLEYRFNGSLGYGGKLWLNDHECPRVDCYSEDMTPERRKMIKKANEALQALYGQVKLT